MIISDYIIEIKKLKNEVKRLSLIVDSLAKSERIKNLGKEPERKLAEV